MSEVVDQEKVVKIDKVEDHPISLAINDYIHAILDIEDCAKRYITDARNKRYDNAVFLKSQLEEVKAALLQNNNNLHELKKMRSVMREVRRHRRSEISHTIEKSLYIYIFSEFDKLTGILISILFNKKPELFKSINKEMSLSEVLQAPSIEKLRDSVLEKEIESIRRKSYLDQFKDLENRFGVTLTKFDDWKYFIENSQRRNLFTHCDGVVSEQYLSICDQVGYKHKNQVNEGEKLEIGSEYFLTSTARVMHVGVMLAQTLWRKVLPHEIEIADESLVEVIFDFLNMEQWIHAKNLSDFAMCLPKYSSDTKLRLLTVNHAIALRNVGMKDAAINMMNKRDWSSCSYDFKLAYKILTDDYKAAAEIMKKLGQEGELIEEISYHDWPLFRDFRSSQEFLDAYAVVYGYEFSLKATSIAQTTSEKIDDCV